MQVLGAIGTECNSLLWPDQMMHGGVPSPRYGTVPGRSQLTHFPVFSPVPIMSNVRYRTLDMFGDSRYLHNYCPTESFLKLQVQGMSSPDNPGRVFRIRTKIRDRPYR
jgi:hypothetical protein